MISGAAQADVCLLMVPADGNFTTAIQKGDHKAGEIQGQTRQHARLINLLGVRQLIVGINKMDSDTAGYKASGGRAGQRLRAGSVTARQAHGAGRGLGRTFGHPVVCMPIQTTRALPLAPAPEPRFRFLHML